MKKYLFIRIIKDSLAVVGICALGKAWLKRKIGPCSPEMDEYFGMKKTK